jgi:hypothetical protein
VANYRLVIGGGRALVPEAIWTAFERRPDQRSLPDVEGWGGEISGMPLTWIRHLVTDNRHLLACSEACFPAVAVCRLLIVSGRVLLPKPTWMGFQRVSDCLTLVDDEDWVPDVNQMLLDWIRHLGRDNGLAFTFRESCNLLWCDDASFSIAADRRVAEYRRAVQWELKGVTARLVELGAMTPEERRAVGPRIHVDLLDLRGDQRRKLPEAGAGQATVGLGCMLATICSNDALDSARLGSRTCRR